MIMLWRSLNQRLDRRRKQKKKKKRMEHANKESAKPPRNLHPQRRIDKNVNPEMCKAHSRFANVTAIKEIVEIDASARRTFQIFIRNDKNVTSMSLVRHFVLVYHMKSD